MKTVKIIITLAVITILSGLFPVLSAHAQIEGKHPRVLELEKELARQGLDVMKGRFPSRPFMITVSIDPLMRDRRAESKTEKLPSYDSVDEEIVDEWDDPSIANVALIPRVRKITVTVSVPANLSEEEVGELKSALVSSLNLIEARDTIDVRKRNWSSLSEQPTKDAKDIIMDILLAGLGIVVVMACLYGLSWYATDRLGKSYREAAQMQKGGSAPVVSAAPSADPESRKNAPSGPAGDVRFDDPIRTRESIASAVRLLEEHRSFPTLDDMILFDQFSQKDPARLGALLSEFSFEVRNRLFSYSSGRGWLTAFSEPGEVSLPCIEVLNKCLRIQRNDLDKDWQELLTLTWRLDSKISEFFQGLPSKEAFAILSCLPKIIALPAAREAYPGAWAILLDAGAVHERPSTERIAALKKKAVETLPLRDQKSLEKFRREKELMSFLKVADPGTEKEIYTTAGRDSFLLDMRPPFFPVFEAAAETLDVLVPRLRIDEWALALFNISRVERKEIEKRMGDKQRIRYFELLRSYDGEAPDKQRIGDAREKIGRMKHQIELDAANSQNADVKTESEAA